MILLIEVLVLCALFTVVVVGVTIHDPLSMVHDYPPEIRERVRELGLLKEAQDRKSVKFIIKKIFAVIIFALVFSFFVREFHGANSFLCAFLYSYLLWMSINWYDALVLDLLWFRNSKKVQIPGTEGMEAYKDCVFHLKAGIRGSLLGLPVCLLAGGFAEILNWLISIF